MKSRTSLSALLLALVSSACSPDENSPVHGAYDDAKQELGEAAEATKVLAAKQLEELGVQLDSKVEDAKGVLAKLKGKATVIAIEHKPELDALIAEVKAKREALEGKLGEVKTASGDALERLSREAGKAGEELEDALQRAAASLKDSE